MNAERLALTILASLAATSVSAQGMPDPTRPPAIIDAAPAAASQTRNGVQSIVRRRGANPAAVINGQLVELGGRIGGARLVEIGEDSVVLQGEFGRETLQLTPGIAKQPVKPQRRGRKEAKP